MTVEELIYKLETIRDKTVPVVLIEWSIQNPLMAKADLTMNRIVVQPHRVGIIVE
jgi:hypothetical protein